MKLSRVAIFLIALLLGAFSAGASDKKDSSEKEGKKECDPCFKSCFDKGFSFKNDWLSLRINAYLQADARFFTDWHPLENDFFIRRARLSFSGTLCSDWGYCFSGAFEGTSASLEYGWLEYKKFPWATLRVGEYRQPFSMEAMHSSNWIQFIERALGPTNIAPFEDIGGQLAGTFWDERVNYAISVYNGQGRNNPDSDSSKEVTTRVFFQPFRCWKCSTLEMWTFGGSLSTGRDYEIVEGDTYKTAARTPFLTFGPDTWEDGTRLRWGAETEYIWGPFIAQGEYLVYDRDGIQNGLILEDMKSHSWYASASYVITGEHKESNKPIVPCYPFDPCKGRWGAWEVGVRYEEFVTDDNVFVDDLVLGAKRVTAWTAGLSWTPNEYIRIMLNYIYTDFNEVIEVNDGLIGCENVLLLRFQWAF